jgi:hypothetical protein
VIDVEIDSLQTSCGTGVPAMRIESDRSANELLPYYRDLGPDGVDAYWRKKNMVTIDGKPTGLFKD